MLLAIGFGGRGRGVVAYRLKPLALTTSQLSFKRRQLAIPILWPATKTAGKLAEVGKRGGRGGEER
jgi:hypothetical protein